MGKKLLGMAFCAILLSCSDNMLNSPKSDGSDDKSNTSSTISAPQDLTATKGGKQSVSLSWKSVNGAYRYIVFSADTPFDEYKQIWETSDTNWTATISAGKNKYFKVQAVNYANTKSAFSNVVMGSTLACPVITSVEMGSEGDTATVNWWMENCTKSTYGDEIRFSIIVYAENKTDIVKQVTVAENADSAVIDGLSPKTKYYFAVEAYILSDQSSVETSGLIDAETARKLIPEAPADFTVTQGISETDIVLQWTCPDYVDVVSDGSSYELKPVYFKIFRRKASENENSGNWTTIVNYIGSVQEGNDSSGIYNFDCTSNSTSDERLSVEAASGEGAVTVGSYKYISLSKIKWIDKASASSLERGVKYEYKVQAFVDDTSKSISSESSASTGTGWLVSIPALTVKGQYEKAKDEAGNETDYFSKISFAFKSEFENFDLNYSYILQQDKYALTDSDCTTSIKKSDKVFSSINDINSYAVSFSNPGSEDNGYYKWTVYVAPEGSTDSSAAYTKVAAAGKFIVTNDGTLVPKISGFTVTDGFADKFNFTFDYNGNYSYRLRWIPVVDGQNQEEQSLDLTTEAGLAVDGSTASFSHTASSGDTRIYILEANNEGITDEVQSDIVKTLGTVKINAGEKFYDSIEVNWKAVQMADCYVLEAYFTDSPETKLYESEEITSPAEGETLTEKFDDSTTWQDASLSGKSVTVKITSKNKTTLSETESTFETETLGPALVNQTAAGYSSNSISISWKKIDGAAGYIVGRGRCSDGTTEEVESADSYFVSADGSSVKIESDSVDGGRVSVNLDSDGKITLTDVCVQTSDEETSQISYKVNQSKISWGQEFQYSVIPVLSENDFEFEVKEKSLVLSSGSKVQYTNLGFIKNSATGYGLDIKAAKAESDEKIKLTWKKPYSSSSEKKIPSVFTRECSNTGAWKKVASVDTLTEDSVSAEIIPSEKTQPGDFLIVYNNGNSGTTIEDSYEKELKSLMASDSPTEPQNKGYLLSLNGIAAGYVSGYTEQVSWTTYDFDSRALGPDYYELQVFNSNTTKGWTTIGKITPDVAAGDYGNTVDTSAYAESAKIKNVSVGTASLQLEPVFDLIDGTAVSDGSGTNTSGMLKVLRDPKHYYRLVAYRKVDDETTASAAIGSDYSVYGYRNVTDEELAKAAMLALSYTFYLNDGGAADLSNVSSQFKYGGENTWTDSNGGTATFEARERATYELGAGKYKCHWSLDNYAPQQITPAGITSKFLSLTQDESGSAICGDADNYVYGFMGLVTGTETVLVVGKKYTYNSTNTLTVGTGDKNLGSIYSGTIYWYCPDKNTLTLKVERNGTTKTLCETTDTDVRRRWFPAQIHSAAKYEIKTTDYGWWEE